MNTLTHALLPVLGTAITRADGYWTRRRLWVVAGCGALPDLLNPHLGLEARLTSWTHGLPAWLGWCLLWAALARVPRLALDRRLVLWMAAAYGLHLACDAVSGGLAWLYPFDRGVVGGYYVPPMYWIPLDGVLAVAVYLVYRALPRFRRARQPAAD